MQEAAHVAGAGLVERDLLSRVPILFATISEDIKEPTDLPKRIGCQVNLIVDGEVKVAADLLKALERHLGGNLEAGEDPISRPGLHVAIEY